MLERGTLSVPTQIGLMRRGHRLYAWPRSNMSWAASRRCLSVPTAFAKEPLITRAVKMIARPASDRFMLNCLEQHGIFPRQMEICRR